MIDHMILDLQKYYKGQVPNYIGRKIKLPLKPIPFYGDPNPYNGTGDIKSTILEITEDGATATTTSGSFNYAGTICQVVIQTCGIVLNNGKDTKKINGTFQTFVCPRFLNDEQQNMPNSSSMPGWLCLSQIIENGGVSSSPLTHLYQGLRHLLDRKVALVND